MCCRRCTTRALALPRSPPHRQAGHMAGQRAMANAGAPAQSQTDLPSTYAYAYSMRRSAQTCPASGCPPQRHLLSVPSLRLSAQKHRGHQTLSTTPATGDALRFPCAPPQSCPNPAGEPPRLPSSCLVAPLFCACRRLFFSTAQTVLISSHSAHCCPSTASPTVANARRAVVEALLS